MILGIDYGEKRIGLALGDETIKISLPFKLLENKGEDKFVEDIKQIVKDESVSVVVLGLPLTLKGESGPKAEEIKKIAKLLEENLEIEVELVDERLSSRLADVLAENKNKNRDIGAAMVILEDYLARLPEDC